MGRPKMTDAWRGVQLPRRLCLSMYSRATISPHFFSLFSGRIKVVISYRKTAPLQCYIFRSTGVEGTSQNDNRQGVARIDADKKGGPADNKASAGETNSVAFLASCYIGPLCSPVHSLRLIA